MKTALYERHIQLGAKMVEFAGWQMPLQYSSVVQEHMATRTHVGLFDVSHMGVIRVTGADAAPFLDSLSTNQILGKPKHTAIYTVLPHESLGCVDDCLIYIEDDTHFFVVVNASNRMKALNHLKAHAAGYRVVIQDRFQEDGILALQGPNALKLILPLFPESEHLKKMHFTKVSYHGQKIILSKTGYTGELGFEIYAPNALIVELFDWFMNEGKPFGLQPVGLGARDTLRLEMGYSLYGHEISDAISANESLSSWTIKWDRDFLGKNRMKELAVSGKIRYEYGVVIDPPGIARGGFAVFKEGRPCGLVTSGNYSPVLDRPIAIILVSEPLQKGEFVEIKIRDDLKRGSIVSLPFIQTKETL